MFRKLALLAVIGVLAVAAYGSAASLGVGSGTIQVGSSTGLSCDPDGVTVNYNVRLDGVVTSVQVNDIEAACAGNRLFVLLKNAADQTIGVGGQLTGGGFPVEPMPTTLFTSLNPSHTCDAVSCKIAIASVLPDGSTQLVGWWGDNYGADGAAIEKVVVMIEGDN
jgi:hypothetical protein